ncbi:MAG: hypothetical protein JJ975_07595 [Bacteroidia bacterium]|nr:hypothetical protein [Bacteroidia bacterium]
MAYRFRDRINYRFERFISKGGASIFKSLLIVFILGFLFIIGLRYLLLICFPDLDYTDNFFKDIWITFLQMTDPGNMNQDNDAPLGLRITTIIAGFLGVIILSMLIAFITTSLESLLYDFRKGRGKVLEEDHTLILGWNERVVDIIRELIIANESEKKASIVILAMEDKEHMDDTIAKRLPDTLTTEVITTGGDPSIINELERVNAPQAKSILILSNCSENAVLEDKIESDVQSIKSIMAVRASQGGSNGIPLVAEIFTEEKREIIRYFDDDNIIALDSWEIMGKLMMQTSLSSGLQIVYSEILSFDGCEIYFYEADWDGVLFGNIAYHFRDGIPLGIFNEKDGLVLRPEANYVMQEDDQILILAEDDSTIDFEKQAIHSIEDKTVSGERLVQTQKNILILGWHSVAKIFITEANDYLKEDTSIDIVFNQPPKELRDIVKELSDEFDNFRINLIDANPLMSDELQKIDPAQYDNVIVLSQSMEDHTADKIDSDTLIILLLLRKLTENVDNPRIITQVLNSENQELINQTKVDEFIISNKLITMILSQLSEEPLIKLFYDDIFSEDGSEIYVKPAYLYFDSFPQTLSFAEIMKTANARDEICLGIRDGDEIKNSSNNFGVKLNLDKGAAVTLRKNDFLVVLSEDEL